MKLNVQLYIGSSQVELFDDESISVTSSIQNVKDIAKIFTDFSQSFSVPASRANNKIFKHYYDSDVVGGFDARYKVDAELQINYMPFRKGKIRLDGVQMKNNKAYAYKLTFFGNTVTLKDLLGEDLLSDIDFSDYNKTYSFSSVVGALSTGATVNGVTDAIITPLISAEERWYYDSLAGAAGNLYASGTNGGDYRNMKYAIRLHCIIKEIENTYTIANGYPVNLTFSNDFFNDATNTDFYNLYMWMHRQKGRPFQTDVFTTLVTGYPIDTSFTNFLVNTDSVLVFNSSKFFAEVDLTTATAQSWTAYVKKDGVIVAQDSITNGTGMILTIPMSNTTGKYQLFVEAAGSFSINVDWDVQDLNAEEGKMFTTTPNPFILNTSLDFIVSDQIPKIKVIDFLTGLFKMFNLTAYESAGEIVVMPLDDFYLSGTSRDITKYVDVNESNVTPATLLKQINFGFEGIDSYITKKHNELFNYNWAEVKYNIENKFEGEVYDVKVPFEHMKFERLVDVNTNANTDAQWGWMVDNLDEDGTPSAYIGKPLIFYAPKVTGTTLRFTDTSTTLDKTSYFIPSNSKDITSSQNINFNAEVNEYAGTVFTDTLFQTYYSTYIGSVFNISNRITKITAYLPLSILLNYTLADTFIINGKGYKINSISTDLTTGKSQIELLNIV